VYCLTTGVVRPKAGERGVRRYLVDDWADRTMPVNVFAVEHEEGICLVDTGQTADATRPGYFPGWWPFFRLSRFELRPEDEAAPTLERLGIGVERVRWVVLTHLHTDHVGGLAAFASSEVLVSRTEWRRATGLSGRARGYLPQRWPRGLVPQLVDFTGPAIGPFAGSFDVAGDGRLSLVPLPGHTAGHGALLVRDDETAVLLAGDAGHTARDLARTAAEVDAWCRREKVLVLTAHDSRAHELLARGGVRR
jgi:glyoxylase-like metal-dependent hydrolase (beta-lactamase superfamily II)